MEGRERERRNFLLSMYQAATETIRVVNFLFKLNSSMEQNSFSNV